MLHNIILFLILIVVAVSCKRDTALITVTRQNAEGNVETYSVLRKDTTVKQGPFVVLSASGDTLEKMYYEKGLPEGQRVLFSDKGAPYIIEHYSAGVYNGPYEAYYEEGYIKQKGQYVNGVMEGVWTTYYKDFPGVVKEEVTFAGGVENGPFREYHTNGKLLAEGNYKDEFEDGELKVYDTTGVLRKIYMYKDKKPVETINVP
jgi:antitoxin component YwqK of YwqJK toxin-antitoxin module